MKTKHLIISALIVLGTIAACKKEKTTPTTPEPTNPNLSKNGCVLSEVYGESFNKLSFLRSRRIDRSTVQSRNQKTNAQVLNGKYFYDAQGRVTKFEGYDTDSTGTAILEYSEAFIYSTGSLSIVLAEYDEQGNPYDKDTLTATTNSFGFITAITEKLPNGDEYSATSEYNAEGYLTKVNTKDVYTVDFGGISRKVIMTTVYLYEYTNGNLLKETETETRTEDGQPGDTYNTTRTYEYGSQLMQPNFINDELQISGTLNKNLVKKRTEEYIYNNQPAETYISTYSYELDAKGNVTKQLTTYEGSSTPYESTYKYTCK